MPFEETTISESGRGTGRRWVEGFMAKTPHEDLKKCEASLKLFNYHPEVYKNFPLKLELEDEIRKLKIWIANPQAEMELEIELKKEKLATLDTRQAYWTKRINERIKEGKRPIDIIEKEFQENQETISNLQVELQELELKAER